MGMTREDAKKTLQDMWECLFNEMTNHTFEDLKEHGMLDNYSTAFSMAMSALSDSADMKKIRAEIIQDIHNGVIQITKGSNRLFEIIDKYIEEMADE